MKLKEYLVYIITNNINGKIYVGRTTMGLNKRFWTHCNGAFKANKQYAISCALRKYGKENFNIKVLEKCLDKQSMIIRETFWIKTLKSYIKGIGYNLIIEDNNERVYTKENYIRNIHNSIKSGKRKSKYYGVIMINRKNKEIWATRITCLNLTRWCESEMEAAILWDKFVIYYKLDRPLNFPNNKYSDLEEVCLIRKNKKNTKYIGVSRMKNRWQSFDVTSGIKVNIGTFDSAEEAARARDKYIIYNKLNKKLNFKNE